EPPAVYRLNLDTSPLTIVKISNQNGLVYPAKIIIDPLGEMIVLDRGEALTPRFGNPREWRSKPHEFGVSILYSKQRPIKELEQRNKTVYGLSKIIESQKPVHSSWTLKTF
ncbi:MAG: hypothetical protein HC935_03910, partial [Pseudanabaena sp. SU_2_4]|nr:hypothetical protein [Pseudanabaena sp. SU_2_4]